MNTVKLLRKLAVNYPKSIKSPGDRIGLMTGKLPENVSTILLALDFDDIVYDKMMKMEVKPDLILTHHPFIYGTRYHVLSRNPIKKDLCDRIDALGIPVYSMHTNFDTGKNGMNDALAEAIGLKNIHPLETCAMARGGELPEPMEIHEFAKMVSKALNVYYVKLIHAGVDYVQKVAVVGGAGSYKYQNALAEGYDIFLSGDIMHHIRRDIIAAHFNFLDIHHEAEKIFVPHMKKVLLSIDPTLNIIEVDHEELPELITE